MIRVRVLVAFALPLFVGGCDRAAHSVDAGLSTLPSNPGPLDALNRRHARLRERMRRRGYAEELGLARAFLLEGRGVAYPLDLEVDRCSTFLALGGGTIRRLDLALYDADGAEAANDATEGEGALVHACPQGRSSHRPHYLVLRSVEGSGAAIVAQFGSTPGSGDGFDNLFEGVLAPRVAFRDVEQHLARSRNALRARGFAPIGPPLLARLAEGSVARLPIDLDLDHCYVATGRSGQGLRDVDLFLFDGAGVEVARDLAGDAEPSIEHCPRVAGRYTVELRAFEGAGAVGLTVFAGERSLRPSPQDAPEASDRPQDGDPSGALAALAAPLRNRGFGAPVFVSRDAAIVPGEVRTHEVVIGPGCGLIAGAASHEGMDLDLYLADATGVEADRDTAVHSTARVHACRDRPTVFRVAVKAYGGDGAYALALLRAPDGVDSLQRLRLDEASAPFRLRGYVETATSSADLREGQETRRELAIAPGRCVAVAAAGSEGVADLDVFLRDAQGELVASESGPAPHGAVTRCAADRAERLTLEIAMYRGAGSVAVSVMERVGAPER